MKTQYMTVGSANKLILPANKQRKSWSIYVTTDNLLIAGNELDLASSYWLVPEGTVITCSIPEDVPQFEVWGKRQTANSFIYIMEEFKKTTGRGARNI